MKQFHLNGFLRRSCSAVLALALCMPPAVLADEGKARIQTSQTILDGLTYTNTVSEHTSGRVESFLLELEEDSPVLILEDDLYQIIFNLMENGIKYNLPGGTLTVRLRREEDNAILEVTDTGMGIPEDAIGHVFERFYRVDKARSRATGGSGLGLAIVRTIVQRNRGEINVRSTFGKGTTFSVTFPAFDAEVDSE